MNKQNTIHVVSICVCTVRGIYISEKLKGEYAGRRQTPGGRVEAKEHLMVAAKRELYEETGLSVFLGDLRPLGTFVKYNTKGVRYLVHSYLYRLRPRERLRATEPDKSSAWRMFRFKEVATLPDEFFIPGVKAEASLAEYQINNW